jgi:hypothetical protein
MRGKSVTAGTEKKLRNLKPFKPGQSGNPKGRPKGARNRLGTQFLEALEAEFRQFGPHVADPLVSTHAPELQGPVAANSQDQLRDTIWPEIAKCHRQLPDALKGMIDVQAERVVVVQDPDGAFAVRRTASKDNPEALQGFHAEHLRCLIDEASGIPDIVFEVGMGALSTPGAKVVMADNPTRTAGLRYASFS